MTVTWHRRGLFCPDLLSVFREVLCRDLRAAFFRFATPRNVDSKSFLLFLSPPFSIPRFGQ